MKFAAIATVPAQYHAPIYQHLAIKFGDDFLAIFRNAGHANQREDPAWNSLVHNKTGITTGYNHLLLDPKEESNPLSLVAKLIGHLKKFRPDAILVNSHRSLMCRAAIEYARFANSNVVLRSTPYDLNARNMLSNLSREVFLRLAYQSINGFAALGTLPRIHFEHFSQRPEAVFFSPYCTDEFVLKPLAKQKTKLSDDFRKQHAIGPDEFIFLICGRLALVKRIDWSLRAFMVFRKNHKARLLIAGNGPSFPLVENAVNELPKDIIWLGFQNRQGVARAIAASNALLLPSLYETWGVIVNEALMFGKPIVASSNVSSSVDLIQDGVTGFKFPVNDESEFTRCLYDVYELSKSELDNAAFDKLNNRFSVNNAVAGILAAAGK